jgi:hypothetical protein
MAVDEPERVRTALRAALAPAMKARDREAVRTYRVALSAIDNAEAVPLTESDRAGAVESAAVGPGATERPRRDLAIGEQVEIVRRESAEWRDTARLIQATDPDLAATLAREADRLDAIIEGAPGGS